MQPMKEANNDSQSLKTKITTFMLRSVLDKAHPPVDSEINSSFFSAKSSHLPLTTLAPPPPPGFGESGGNRLSAEFGRKGT